MRHSFLQIILLCLWLAACTPAATRQPTAIPLPSATMRPSDTPQPTDAPTDTPLPVASATIAPTLPPPTPLTYTIGVEFDYDGKTASVTQRIDYYNTSAEVLNDLRLMVPSTTYAGAFNLRSLAWVDGTAIANTSWQESALIIPLIEPLPPQGNVSLQISFDLAIPSAALLTGSRPIPFGYTVRQTNLVNWYAVVPPYRAGTGWLAHPNSFYGESLVEEIADFDVTLQLASPRADLTIAASAPAEMIGDAYHYQLKNGRSFAFSIGHDYRTSVAQAGDVSVTSYYFSTHSQAGQAAAEITAKALQLFSERLTPYPHAALAVVEADFLDGMEYDGLFFVSKGMYNLYTGQPGDYLTAITAHETAHQWWYGRVGSDQAMEPWLDEALCTYSELLYFEAYHPSAMQWWWDVRINYYRPSGWVDSTVYDQIGLADSYELYRNAVYLNGAVFMDELRRAAGDEAFFNFLKDYAQTFEGKFATGADFFATFQRHSQTDLSEIRSGFFKNP